MLTLEAAASLDGEGAAILCAAIDPQATAVRHIYVFTVLEDHKVVCARHYQISASADVLERLDLFDDVRFMVGAILAAMKPEGALNIRRSWMQPYRAPWWALQSEATLTGKREAAADHHITTVASAPAPTPPAAARSRARVQLVAASRGRRAAASGRN